ncbi:putative non-ribosomal peptide synthetase [Xylaria castorea]|nr:putative non-ribosomal peptide synthetase [Xylaria castorea]
MPADHSRSLHTDDGVSILNAKPKRLPGPCFLHELVSLASNDGVSAAIEFLPESGRHISLSYAELHAASLALAASISCILRSAQSPTTSASAARDPLVIPILSPQSPQLYVAILAALKAGGAFCPLNADAPPDRVRFILQDVHAEIVLASRELASKIPMDDKTYKVIFIDDVLDCPETKVGDLANRHELAPEDFAYVMYTSGSTGTPKGVAVSHLAATQSILAHERHIPSFSRFLQFAAPTFDVSIFEIFFPLFRGATLVGCHRAEMLTDLVGVLTRMEVDACELTPSVAGSLLKQRSRAPGLRLLLTIGEMLTEPVIREFGGKEGNMSILWGMYGPTEAAIHCTVQAAFPATLERSMIGTPFETVSAFVIRVPTDKGIASQFEILPLGEVGELALGGLQLATCYLNRPQQTATSFVNTPWGRVYRTGDKAKIRPDGTIQCLGRIEEGQVKLNGQRLELGEVEQVLLRTQGCHSAAVAVISNILVAFAAMELESDSNTQLWTQCRSWLPSFMVPTDIVVMEQLPQLPSGKVDRKRLINDYMAERTITTEDEEAIDDCERFLCEIATAILGERVGPLTEFSAAKLDSLTAIEYASSLRERGISVAPVDILGTKTPRELRRRIEGGVTSAAVLDSNHQATQYRSFDPYLDKVKLGPLLGDLIHEIDRVEGATPLQQSMIAETLKGAHLYINQVEFELTSPVTPDILQSSLKTLAEWNEILRTGFTFVENQLCQVIWKQLDANQLYDDFDGNSSEGKIADVESFLLRPLKIDIRRPKAEKTNSTLFLTLHHAIYDGWTIDLIIEDLSLLLSGKLPTKRPQFSQVMRYLQYNSELDSIDSMEFWSEHLRGVGAVTASNFQTIAVIEPQLVVTTTRIPLHPSVLKDLMLKASVGPQVLFQACLVWLWAAFQGSEDIAIGCVSSGRSLPLPGIDKLMGPCMMTLPLRINISRYRTIIELLQSIHSINRETLRHGHLQLSKIRKAAGLSTNSSLFDVIFAYQESLASRRAKSNVVRETWHRDATEAKLVVEIQPCGDHFICQTTSQTNVLPQHLTESLAHHLSSLVGYFSSHFDAPIGTIPQYFPLYSLSHFNDNPKSMEPYCSLPEMVEQSASRFPSASALCFATSISPSTVDSQSLSYHELNSKANQIARHLGQRGLKSGSVIAIVMNKSPLLYCSILGILKSGCAYLPILPSTPIERINVILDQAEPRLCVVDMSSSSLILDRSYPKIINMETAVLSSNLDTNLGIRSEPSDLAYVIYTSGTTGVPKGVAVTNRNITSNISILSGIYPHDPSSRMLQACSQAFDVSVFEIFFAWANSMCLCAATNDTLFEDFEQAVRAFRITHLSPTVTVASLLSPKNVPTVEFLVTSGEPMTDEVLDRWSQHLYQGYGPSETTNICTVRKVSKGDSSQFLGWSFDNTSTFVLHPSSTHLVPIGCIGELCFGGDQVASGYLKLPEATAAKFIDHPKYGRLYRSGDLGRMFSDGSLLIHGRIDTQVKLRGLRIELQEIQTIALRTGLTRACKSVLITFEDAKLQQLSLFYVPSNYDTARFQLLPITNNFREQGSTLRYTLQSFLPDYMVPTFIFPISTLPLTSSGKVDEGKLCTSIGELSPSALDAYSSTEDHPDAYSDWSETEMLVADVVTNLLEKDRSEISRWTAFSALGLDSISAMPVARRLQSVLRKRVPLSLLLQNPNINRLAYAIDGLMAQEEPTYSSAPLLPPELEETMRKRFAASGKSVAKVLPCTPLQEAMVMSSLNPSSATANNEVAYYNQMLFHLRVPYEVIMNLWNEVVRRHEILRALFVTSDDIRYPAIQIILHSYIPEWKVLETEGSSLREQASEHIASTSSTTDCDKPPMALAIIRTKDSGDYLSFVCHHAMYDGISMRIMLSEIEALYHGRLLSEPPSLESFLQEMRLSDPGQDGFWKQLLFGFQPSPLRCKDFLRDTDTMPKSVSVKAPGTSLKLIESQLRDLGVSMLALIQTAWAITLSILSQRSDVSFGSVVNGRSIPSNLVDNLVAPCFNTLPIRMDISVSTFLVDVMKIFQSLNAKLLLYQFTSLRHIQKKVDTQTRLFDTLVILQPPTTPLDNTLWSLVYEDGLMDVPIVCEVIPSDLEDTLIIQLHRDKSKFSYEALELIGNIFGHILDICLRYPSSHILTREGLPNNWHKDIPDLFHHVEDTQISSRVTHRASTHEETWSPMELTVRHTLAKLAEIPEEEIGRLTPIYRYGLDSITAIQLATLLRQQNVSISAIDVIEYPTCAGIAGAVKNSVQENFPRGYDFGRFQKQVEGEILGYGVDFETVETVLPCTATQQGLLSKFLESQGRYYFNYSSWALSMKATPEITVRAWSQLANHHQILRTGFVPLNHPDSSFAMVTYRKSHFTAPITTYQSDKFNAEKWLSNATVDALDTLTRPPWRLALVASENANSEQPLTIHIAMHHALYDAFTLRRLLQDLNELISSGNEPEATNIDRALSHYLDLVQSNQSAGEAFWKQKADNFAFHTFPVMTPLHVVGSNSSTTSRTCNATSSLLRHAASEAGITVQVALQAAWTRLLSAYVGESRVTFGVVFDGRTTDIARKSTLPMITTLPVIAEDVTSNSELLQQMMLYNRELRRFQFTPMAQIQRAIGTTGPLFDTILIYQAADKTTKPLPIRAVQELASVEYLVSLEVEESHFNATLLNLVFRDSVLPQEQAALLLSQFEAILMDLLTPVESVASRVDIKKPDIFSILPPSCDSLSIETDLLHGLLERSAQLLPSAIALEFIAEVAHDNKARKWTYQELDAFGNQVAHFITKHGVGPGNIIATCFNKCPIAYFTLLGILKAGCAFLCLDPSAPAVRQLFILNDSNAAMLMHNEPFEWVGETSLPVHTINENMLESLPTLRPSLQREVSPSDSCYCLYTSGTTGAPKGCLISHENAVQAMAAFKYLFTGRWDADSRWLQFAAFHFDVSVLEQYWSWYVGITVVAAPKDVILSDLAMTISKLEITHIDLTPSLARLINPDECPSLCKGVFITGGEKLRSDILSTWGSKRVIHNAYGPTEATIGITMYCGVPQNGRPSNIGNLFPNVGAYIFKRGSETPVLRGGVGELCVSGKLVGKGYLNRDSLTKERFPVLQPSGERIYRTGDLVRVLHDGSLDFLGRADDQIKLRGQRLEIGEINHAIREGLADKAGDVATMVARRRGQDINLLVSFVAPTSDASASREVQIHYDVKHIEFAGRAQEACRSRLATYMVPSFVICVSRIPLSTNNKVDISQLKSLFSELSHEQLQDLSTTSLSSRRELSGLESQVLEAIYQVVHVKENDVMPSTTIFELGIDSITTTRLAKQLRTMGFASATPSMILRHPQISQLSQALHRPSSSTPNSNTLQVKQSITAFRHRYLGLVCETLKVNTTEVEYIAPCTPLQQGIIARSKAREAQLAYFNQFQLRLDSTVSVVRLKAALSRIIESYSILRTAFVDIPDGFLQVAIKNRPLRWFEVEAKTESFEQTVAERQRHWIEANNQVLEWPVEVDHIEVKGHHHLLLRLFHGVYDARSLDIIFNSLEAEYEGASWSSGPAFISVLPEGPLLSHQESHRFWKSLLGDHRLQPMPNLTDTFSTTSTLICRSIKFEGLEDKRKQLQVTHQTLLQAAWLHTLRPYFVHPPTIGVILSGRSLAIDDIDLVVGPLFNTLPLRVDNVKNMSWVSLTREIQKHNNSLLTFVHTPLRDIQKICASGQPLFDTLFTFDREYKAAAKSKPTPWSIQDSSTHPDYPLAIEIIMVEDDMFCITLAAQGSIADESALNSLLGQFTESLNSLIASSHDAPLSSMTQTAHPKTHEHISRAIPEMSSTSNGTVTPKNSFSWNDKSHDVRRELAVLARADEKEISEATNLFSLGLDSIDVIKLSGRLKKLGYHVSVGTLMKQPTLASIVTILERSVPPTTDPYNTSELDGIISILEECYHRMDHGLSDVEAILPPTPLQDSMVAEMLRSNFQTYFNHDVLQLPQNIDIDRLKLALSELYANSPILRTAFVEVDDPRISSAYCQVVRKSELEFAPIMQIPNMDSISMLTNLARTRAVENKGKSNLFQIQFAELERGKLMVLSIAHALYDGWSLQMLHKDIQAAYERNYIPRSSYKPYLSRMLARSNSSSRKFWTDLLHGAHATLVPKVSTTNGQNTIHRFEKQSRRSAADIREICKDLRVTPQVLGQACWAAVLASLTRSLDVVFGVVLSGRETEEAQGLMFPTMNTVPLRLALHGSITEFLGYSQDIMSSVVEFQHTPLRDIQKLSQSNGDRLFNTIFLLQNPGDNEADSNSFLESAHSVSAVDYPICAELELTGKDAVWRIACDNDYMDSEDVKNLGSSLERVLDYFAEDGDEQVLKFSSHGSQMVSICGLSPMAVQTELRERENALVIKGPNSQYSVSLPQGQEIILDVLSDLSKIDRNEIDLSLSIFHIGLDSISAIKASSILRKRGLKISTRDLVTIPSIRGILEQANRATNEKPEYSARNSLQLNSVIDGKKIGTLIQQAGLDVDSIETILPALPMQVHMLSVWRNSGGATFFPKFAFKISDPINLTAVSKAWATLVEEIVMLRTHLISTNSSNPPFLQVILKSKFASSYSKSVTTESNGQWEFIYAATPFAVVQILGGESGEANLSLYIHHAMYDGISLPVILNRFAKLCTSSVSLATSVPVTPWYGFALKHFAAPIQAQRESFWTSYLSGAASSRLYDFNKTRAATQGPRINDFRSTAINNASRLRFRGSVHGVSTQALLFAAFSRVFVKLLRQDKQSSENIDCIFGVYLANRSGYPGVEEAPFPTLSILPLRVKDPLIRSITVVAADIQKDITEISKFENSSASLWEIQRWTGVCIDTFVNILSLPTEQPPFEPNSVKLEKSPNHSSPPAGSADMSTYLIAPDSESVSSSPVMNSYPEGIDIELALHEDVLDLGIFGPSSVLSATQVNDMITAILTEIGAL